MWLRVSGSNALRNWSKSTGVMVSLLGMVEPPGRSSGPATGLSSMYFCASKVEYRILAIVPRWIGA